MATLAQLQQRLELLNESIATGELVVAYSDKQVRYRSIAEMLTVRTDLERQIEAASDAADRKPNRYRYRTRGGW